MNCQRSHSTHIFHKKYTGILSSGLVLVVVTARLDSLGKLNEGVINLGSDTTFIIYETYMLVLAVFG